jgi:hypothetical protein
VKRNEEDNDEEEEDEDDDEEEEEEEEGTGFKKGQRVYACHPDDEEWYEAYIMEVKIEDGIFEFYDIKYEGFEEGDEDALENDKPLDEIAHVRDFEDIDEEEVRLLFFPLVFFSFFFFFCRESYLTVILFGLFNRVTYI